MAASTLAHLPVPAGADPHSTRGAALWVLIGVSTPLHQVAPLLPGAAKIPLEHETREASWCQWWIKQKDLVVGGLNVTEGLAEVRTPTLVILANKDGIVPVATARSVVDAIGTDAVQVREVGDAVRWAAHADLFIGEGADKRVFEPMVRFLRGG